MSTLKTSNIQDTSGGNNSTPEEINEGRAKVWVNFNGTGTVAIRDSFNVSSITDNGTGDYTVTFATAMADSNYAVVGIANGFSTIEDNNAIRTGTRSSSAVQIRSINGAATAYVDTTAMQVAVFGG